MNKIKTKKYNYLELVYIIFLLFAIILLIVLPNYSISSFYEGVRVWATKILPTLLPFFILSKLLSYTPLIPFLEKKISPITTKLYGVSGLAGYIYIMSIISGYPVGAKITSDFYTSGKISKGQAQTITAFTSTSGPLFILGTVATGLFGSTKIGIVILFAHYIGALLNGLLYRHKGKDIILSDTSITTKPSNILSDSVSSSIVSVLNIGGFISLFYMLIQLFLSLNIFLPITTLFAKFGINHSISESILAGIIEVTTGEILLSQTPLSDSIITILSTFVISFGGLSIHAQAYSYLQKFEMPYKKFLLQKFTHALLSTLISSIVLCIF